MIVNAENLIVGRMASQVAKAALQGEEIHVINCEKAVFTGERQDLLASFQRKRAMGDAFKGPFYPRMPDKMVKRVIRGMLPYKKSRGREALKRIKCHIGIPPTLESKDAIQLEGCHVQKTRSLRYMSIQNIARLLGYGKNQGSISRSR